VRSWATESGTHGSPPPTKTPKLQLDALSAADCLKVYTDTATGTKADRPQWNACLGDLRRGDTLLIWKIDRLGRNLRDLIDIVTTNPRCRGCCPQTPPPPSPAPAADPPGSGGTSGRPRRLLHGHPRTRTTWHRVAPLLVAAGHSASAPARRRPWPAWSTAGSLRYRLQQTAIQRDRVDGRQPEQLRRRPSCVLRRVERRSCAQTCAAMASPPNRFRSWPTTANRSYPNQCAVRGAREGATFRP